MGPVLAIWLDGFDVELARSLMAEGLLPNLSSLDATSASFRLDHGSARATGLAGEHLATGRSPELQERWAAVTFDPRTYGAVQEGTADAPFVRSLDVRTVVVDPPYFALDRAPTVRGIVGWGAHDPGCPPASRPEDLAQEAAERFGTYPAKRWIYGTPWASTSDAEAMGSSLASAVAARADLAEWLLTERLPDWDLGLVVVSEAHSALEGLWYGIDDAHPLHAQPSAPVAAQGVRDVLSGIDELVGRLVRAVPSETTTAIFSLHGMGPNESDLQSMLLLPELLHRWAFGEPRFDAPAAWAAAPDGVVPLDPELGWTGTVGEAFWGARAWSRRQRLGKARRLPAKVRRSLGFRTPSVPLSLDWMPTYWYRAEWPAMRAFALPSFYDGRIRLNLQGRESQGIVVPSERAAVLDELERLLEACTDPFTGRPVMLRFDRCRPGDGSDVGPTEADAIVTWNGIASAFEHPTYGRIGPLPYRRAGGHSRTEGVAWLHGPTVPAGPNGWRSSFDVVPTLTSLLGVTSSEPMSGRSLLAQE